MAGSWHRWPVGRARVLLPLIFAALFACQGAAPPARSLRVGVATDYPPFAARAPGGELGGLDLDVMRAFVESRGAALVLIPFAWPELTDDLRTLRFHLAIGGISVRPERSALGQFSVPVLESGAILLARGDSAVEDARDANTARVRIAVNRGGHLERVARALFPRAQLLAIADNAAVRDVLAHGDVDAAMTDSVEAPLWEREIADTKRIGPLTRDVKAYWVAPGERDLARALDRWLLAREADGTLARLRARWLAEPSEEAATPARALAAAIAERLALMPAVAEAKRAAQLPVFVPEREAAVVAAARAATLAAFAERGVAAPAPAAIDAFYRALTEAARVEQGRVLAAEPSADASAYSLEGELRPALDRIGERIAFLLAQLPAETDAEALVRDLVRLAPALAAEPERAREIAERARALAL